MEIDIRREDLRRRTKKYQNLSKKNPIDFILILYIDETFVLGQKVLIQKLMLSITHIVQLSFKNSVLHNHINCDKNGCNDEPINSYR